MTLPTAYRNKIDDLRFEQPLRSNPLAILPNPCDGCRLTDFLDDAKQRLIHRAMELTGGVQARAAKLLGITPQALNQLLKGKNHQ